MHSSFTRFGAALTALAAGLLLAAWFAPSVRAGGSAKKLPVPDTAAQAKALALVLDVFKEDFDAAKKSPEAKTKLAQLLLQQGRESRDETANRFVLYQEARELAAAAGNAALALQALDETVRDFDLEAFELKARTLDAVVQNVPTKEAAKDVFDLLVPMIGDALESDNYDGARNLVKVAEAAARKSKVLALVTAMQKKQEEVDAQHKSFARQEGFLKRLKKDPGDAEANLELGKYFALFKGRWEQGLVYLAKGKDAVLSGLAASDLKDPKDGKEQLELADRYWDAAASEKDPVQLQLQRRASVWYDKALPGLAGLNRTKALRRIDIVQAKLAGVGVAPTGPVGEIKKFEGHAQEIKCVALSSDGRYGASVSFDQTVRIWDLVAGKEEKALRGHTKEVWGVVFHPTLRQVISASWDGTVRIWDITEGKEIRKFTHPKDVNGVAMSRDGTRLLAGCDNGSSYLWNAGTGEEIKSFGGHTNFVYGVAFAPDGRHVASGSVDRTARVYDITTGALVKSFDGHADAVNFVAFSADSRFLYTSGDSVVRKFDIAAGKEVKRFEGHTGNVQALAISPDGRRLLSGGNDRTIRFWDTETGKLIETFKGHAESITSVTFSSDGRRALSGSTDRTVRLWGLPR